MIKSFLIGITRASLGWKMVLLLLVTNILFSLPIAVPIFLLIAQTSSGNLSADRMFADKLDITWITDLFNHQMPEEGLETTGTQVGVLLLVMGLSYLLVNTLFTGGILEVFASDDGRFTMRKFWTGCGAYFWRFFRLMMISLFFYAGAYMVYFLLLMPINKADQQATAYQSTVYPRWAVMILLLLLLAFINMVFDYAKISTVINEGRRMFSETFKAFRFVLRHFLNTFGLFLLIMIIGMAFFIVPVWLRSSINQVSVFAVFLAIMLGQVAIGVRMWARLVFYVAQLDLYYRLKPAPERIKTPEPQPELMPAEAPVAGSEHETQDRKQVELDANP